MMAAPLTGFGGDRCSRAATRDAGIAPVPGFSAFGLLTGRRDVGKGGNGVGEVREPLFEPSTAVAGEPQS